VTWLPYDLHPEYPAEGIPRAQLDARYGFDTTAQQRALFARHGLEYAPSERIPNSRDALRVTELARDAGLHEEVHDALMDAFWGRGEDVSEHDVLRRVAFERGLPRDDVERVLTGDDYLQRVLASTREAQSIGISGIPGFLIDSRLLVLGAQPREVFEGAFAQLAATGPK
jgi:predicted DsbA family dithiol-disulfide isomerase